MTKQYLHSTHTVQYAWVGPDRPPRPVMHSQDMTDREVQIAFGASGKVERRDRCEACSTWTTRDDKLHTGTPCAATMHQADLDKKLHEENR